MLLKLVHYPGIQRQALIFPMFDANVGVKREQKPLNHIIKTVKDRQDDDQQRRTHRDTCNTDAGKHRDQRHLFPGEKITARNESDHLHRKLGMFA